MLPYSWLRCTSIGSSFLLKRLHPLELVDDAVAAAEVFVDRHVVLRDHARPVRDEVRAVLGVVLASFR